MGIKYKNDVFVESSAIAEEPVLSPKHISADVVVFRWFKFTLKPPYTITHGNLLSAIWDTSHWTSLVKFGLKTA